MLCFEIFESESFVDQEISKTIEEMLQLELLRSEFRNVDLEI